MTFDRLRLARTEGVGPVTYRRLLRRYGTAAAALDALPGIARAAGRAAPPAIPAPGAVRREMDGLARLGGRFLFLGDPDYPSLLALLDPAPPLLAVLGDPACLAVRAVAVVGARNASANGQRMAEALAADLGLSGLLVVSGLARGIDAAAHRGAMRTGRTVAAIAGGLDKPYPPAHADLQAAIAESGAVVAEAPLGTAPQARHFPRRNRIIAGLSLGTVVIEAAPQSGSLITARMAQEAGRELFAVPGSPLDPRCRGSNDLIRSAGAHLTESAADVLAALPDALWTEAVRRRAAPAAAPPPAPRRPAPGDAPRDIPEHLTTDFTKDLPGDVAEDPDAARLKLLELLGHAPVPVDDLMRRCQFSASAVLGVLQELEAEGVVQQLGGQVCRVT